MSKETVEWCREMIYSRPTARRKIRAYECLQAERQFLKRQWWSNLWGRLETGTLVFGFITASIGLITVAVLLFFPHAVGLK